MKSLTQQFTDWVNTKPADEPYNWYAICGCALFQFYDAHGYPIAHVGSGTWVDHGGNGHAVPAGLGDLCSQQPHTFGGLASRLSHPAAEVSGEGE